MELTAKFKIGDFVYVKQDILIYNSRKEDKYVMKDLIPVQHQIIGIIYDECYAGVQVNYKTRGYHQGNHIMLSFLEFELTKSLDDI